MRWYWSYSPWSQLDVLGEVYPQIRAGMRCCRPPAAFDWLPRLLEIGIRELWIHPRSSPLHCSVDNVSGDFPPLPYPITRPLSCPPDFICHPFSTPWPTALCPCQIFQPHIFQAPICSSSPQGHRVILWFNRGEQSFFSYQTICFSQQAFIRKSRIETPLPEKNPIILFCKFPVNLKSISYNSISILMIHVLYFVIQLKSPGSHTLIFWTWFYIPKLSMSL